MTEMETAIVGMNHRLLEAEGQIMALKEVAHWLLIVVEQSEPTIRDHVRQIRERVEAVKNPNEPTKVYLDAASQMLSEMAGPKEESPRLTLIDGGKSDDSV
jgi:hypothetical protein